MATCPTCGQMTPKRRKLLGREEIYELLRDGQPHREVYRGQDGGWWVTYGGGKADPHAVAYLVEQKYVASVYSSIPDEVFHIGKTLDCEATMAERKKHRRGKDAPKIYTDGTPAALRLKLMEG